MLFVLILEFSEGKMSRFPDDVHCRSSEWNCGWFWFRRCIRKRIQPIRIRFRFRYVITWYWNEFLNIYSNCCKIPLFEHKYCYRSVILYWATNYYYSWFQTFAVFWILCVIFWVFPQRVVIEDTGKSTSTTRRPNGQFWCGITVH
jgi:hypothetical protein